MRDPDNKGYWENGISLRSKFLIIYVGLMTTVVLLISSILPILLNRYLISEKIKDLDTVKSIVAETLESEDFRANPETARTLESTAKAANICVWIAMPVDDNTVTISVFGKVSQNQEAIDFSSFTESEKTLVKSVMDGNEMPRTMRAFPSAFEADTISVGYSQAYLSGNRSILAPFMDFGKMESGAVFLHVALDTFSMTSKSLQIIIAVTLCVVALAATLMTSLMANNILMPVSKLKDAAEAITKGDFSQKVEVRSNDEIGQLTSSFNNMSEQLQSVDTLQSDFIANISHDFRSPLTSIKGYVEAMLDGTIPEEMHAKYLQIVLDEANRLTKMTNNVLDLSKMENGQIELHFTDFDINETIVNLALSLEQRFEDKKIEMNFQFLKEKLYVYADIDLIERVIYNLLDNALKFTDEGDSISVETSVVNKKAYIVVSDTGNGIEEAALPHIFERFNKGDKSRGKNKMGTGLGLAIVKQIMLNHHEDIKVYSKEGEGTTFTFTLPLSTNR